MFDGLDARMRTSLKAVAATGLVFTACALLAAGAGPAFSVGMGAALAVGNLWALAKIVASVFPADGTSPGSPERGQTPEDKPRRRASAWGVVAGFKMIAFLAAVWLLMQEGVVSPIPLVVGVCSLPVGIAIGAVVSDRGEA
jgi:hypothetical protein